MVHRQNFVLPSSLPEVECLCLREKSVANRSVANLMINYLLVALLALALGTVLGILLLRARESALRSRLAALETEVSGRTGELRDARGQLEALNSDKQRAEQEVAVLNERLRQERNGAAEKLDLLTKASQELQNGFHRLAAPRDSDPSRRCRSPSPLPGSVR